jgi:DNA-binding NarL/FixJ family response regulator
MAIRIILADQHHSMRQDLRRLLSAEPGLRVVAEADSGRQTLKLARELAPHVVIMDISMPDLKGLEAIDRLQAEAPGVKVIALSMHADSLFVLNTLKAGACGYLLKDCALEELVKAVRTVAQAQKTYLSPGLSAAVIWESARGK